MNPQETAAAKRRPTGTNATARIAAPDSGLTPEQSRAEEILKQARIRFAVAVNAESQERQQMLEDHQFRAGRHWDPKREAKRRKKDRPVLTIDRLTPAIKRVVNHARQNPPEGRAIPYGGRASKQAAEVFQGFIRHIKNACHADIAQETAFEDALTGGLGWVRITKQYETTNLPDGPLDTSIFNQTLAIEEIGSPFQVYRDPEAKKFDFSDARWLFVVRRLSLERYKQAYPKGQIASLASFTSIGDDLKRDWFPEGDVVVAEYWFVENRKIEIHWLEDGTVIQGALPAGAVALASRTLDQPTVKQVTLNGVELLTEEIVWEDTSIPFVPIIGERILLDGKRALRGMVFSARDASMLLDYMLSKLAEVVGLSPLAPFVAALGQIEGLRHFWDNANEEPFGVLPYNEKSVNGNLLPAPQRQTAGPEIQSIMAGISLAVDNLKAQLDTYDASLGNEGPETSGKAILARQSAGDIGHFHYVDNYSRHEQRVCEILLRMIPKVFNRDQERMIQDPDGTHRSVKLIAGDQFPQADLGDGKIVDLDPSDYQVVVSVGPKFETRRRESRDFLLELLKCLPQAMAPALPMMIRTSDAPDAEKIADTIDPRNAGDEAIPPKAQAQIAQLEQQLQVFQKLADSLTKALNAAEDERKAKVLELASRERIADAQNRTTLAVAELKSGDVEAGRRVDVALAEHDAELQRDLRTQMPPPAERGNPQSEPAAPAQP